MAPPRPGLLSAVGKLPLEGGGGSARFVLRPPGQATLETWHGSVDFGTSISSPVCQSKYPAAKCAGVALDRPELSGLHHRPLITGAHLQRSLGLNA